MTDYTPKFLKRFYAKINKTDNPDECWLWTASGTPAGYGTISLGGSKGKQIYAHRASFEIATGIDPGILKVLHKCDNPPCCNPAHLFLGTDADNARDKVAKGRQRNGISKGESNGMAKLTNEQIALIRLKFNNGATKKSLAREFGVSDTLIRYIITGKNWKHVT